MGVVGADPFVARCDHRLVAVIGQDVANMLVLGDADMQGERATGLQPCVAVSFGQGQQSQAGSITVFRVPVLGQLPCDDLSGGGADALTPLDQALRSPLPVGAMGLCHMLRDRGEFTVLVAAGMAGDPLAAM